MTGLTTLLCLGAGLILRHRAVGDYQSMIVPPSILVSELAAIMVVTVAGGLEQPATRSARGLYYVAATLGLLVAIVWFVEWGVGPVWDIRGALGKPLALCAAAALPLLVTAWVLRLVGPEEWLIRSVVPPLAGFAGTFAIVPTLLTVGCALSGDCL